MKLKLLATAFAVLGLGSISTPALAAAGFIALEGSDATTFHQDPSYTPELFSYLKGSSLLPVLVFQPGGGPAPGPTGGVSTTIVNSLSGVVLSNFSAIYIESTGGCCDADPTVLNGFGAEVSAFVAAGGNLSIENYLGGDYDGVVPGGTGPGGFHGAAVAGTGCTDGELVTAFGISKGFSQPPIDDCWSHQGYDLNYWSAFGYQSLMKSDPAPLASDGFGFANGSSFMATGGTLGGGGPAVPEPGTWAMMLLGLGAIGAALRTSRRSVMVAA